MKLGIVATVLVLVTGAACVVFAPRLAGAMLWRIVATAPGAAGRLPVG